MVSEDRITELRDKAALFRKKAARVKNERQRDFLLEVAEDSERTIARIMKLNAASGTASKASAPEPRPSPRVAQRQAEERPMAKQAKSSRGRKQDRPRVAGGQDYEVRYTAKKKRTTARAVKRAVKKVGSSRKKVERALSRSR